MGNRRRRWIEVALVVAFLSPSLLRAEENPAAKAHTPAVDVPLVTEFKGPAPGPKEFDCNVRDQLTRKVVFLESEKAATRAFLALAGLSHRYEAIRKADFENFHVPLDDSGKSLKGFLDSYLDSAHDSHAVSTAGMFLVVGGFVVCYTHIDASGGYKESNRGTNLRLRLAGWAGSALGGLSSAASSWAGHLGGRALEKYSGELTKTQRDEIGRTLEKGTSDAVHFLGETLKWEAPQRGRFTRALNEEILQTVRKTAYVVPAGSRSQFQLVANLSKISFVDIIRREELADESQLAGLQKLQDLQDMAESLPSLEMVPPEVRNSIDDPLNPLGRRVGAMVRFLRLMQDAQTRLPEGAARQALGLLIEQTRTAVETLRQLCDLGL